MKVTREQLRQLIREELGRLDEADKDKGKEKNPYLVQGNISGTYLESWQTLRHLMDSVKYLYDGVAAPDDWMEAAVMAIHDDDPSDAKNVVKALKNAADAMSELRGSYDWGALPPDLDPAGRA